MDLKIKKIEKMNASEQKALKKLEIDDRKRDRFVEAGKKALKKK